MRHESFIRDMLHSYNKVSNAVLKAFAQGNKAAGLTELILADKEDYFRGCDWATQKEVEIRDMSCSYVIGCIHM